MHFNADLSNVSEKLHNTSKTLKNVYCWRDTKTKTFRDGPPGHNISQIFWFQNRPDSQVYVNTTLRNFGIVYFNDSADHEFEPIAMEIVFVVTCCGQWYFPHPDQLSGPDVVIQSLEVGFETVGIHTNLSGDTGNFCLDHSFMLPIQSSDQVVITAANPNGACRVYAWRLRSWYKLEDCPQAEE